MCGEGDWATSSFVGPPSLPCSNAMVHIFLTLFLASGFAGMNLLLLTI
jgi:hypothetical protein